MSSRQPPVRATKRKRGRPSKRTPKIVKRIMVGLSNGIPLAELCREPGMPGRRTVHDWLRADRELLERYARARDVGYFAIADEILDAVDAPLRGRGDARRMREDVLAHRRMQLDDWLRLLGSWAQHRARRPIVRIIRETVDVPHGRDAEPTFRALRASARATPDQEGEPC